MIVPPSGCTDDCLRWSCERFCGIGANTSRHDIGISPLNRVFRNRTKVWGMDALGMRVWSMMTALPHMHSLVCSQWVCRIDNATCVTSKYTILEDRDTRSYDSCTEGSRPGIVWNTVLSSGTRRGTLPITGYVGYQQASLG